MPVSQVFQITYARIKPAHTLINPFVTSHFISRGRFPQKKSYYLTKGWCAMSVKKTAPLNAALIRQRKLLVRRSHFP